MIRLIHVCQDATQSNDIQAKRDQDPVLESCPLLSERNVTSNGILAGFGRSLSNAALGWFCGPAHCSQSSVCAESVPVQATQVRQSCFVLLTSRSIIFSCFDCDAQQLQPMSEDENTPIGCVQYCQIYHQLLLPHRSAQSKDMYPISCRTMQGKPAALHSSTQTGTNYIQSCSQR